jgi:hypothetical protein
VHVDCDEIVNVHRFAPFATPRAGPISRGRAGAMNGYTRDAFAGLSTFRLNIGRSWTETAQLCVAQEIVLCSASTYLLIVMALLW